MFLKGNCLDVSANFLIGDIKKDCPIKNKIWRYRKIFLDFKENNIIASSVNEEKNNLALKIIPELIRSDARLGISGSFIKPNQIFEKKNAIDTPNKIKILKIYKYEKVLFGFFKLIKLLLIKIAAAGIAGNQ